MPFTHIHCSSRFDRSPESLEADLDRWMSQSSLITLTEVQDPRRTAKIREKGWNHFNAARGGAPSNCAVAWKREMWHRKKGWVRRLTAGSGGGGPNDPTRKLLPVYSATVLLHRVDSERDLLVSVAHLPASTMGHGEAIWSHDEGNWRIRKAGYQRSMANWSTHIKALIRQHNPEGALVVADWNWSLKDDWFRQYLKDHWGEQWRHGWRHFPTAGSMSARGHIIDGSIALNMELTEQAQLMGVTRSSDHKPYKESWDWGKGKIGDDTAGGATKPGKAWWGWTDYKDDSEYQVERAFEGE